MKVGPPAVGRPSPRLGWPITKEGAVSFAERTDDPGSGLMGKPDIETQYLVHAISEWMWLIKVGKPAECLKRGRRKAWINSFINSLLFPSPLSEVIILRN